MTSTALAAVESTRLAELEHVIERGLTTFVEVGQALMEIRDSRLYRDTHAAFEDYCRERWAGTELAHRQNVDAKIRYASVGNEISLSDLPPLGNAGQARELAPLLDQPERLREVWAEVVELHPQPTAADVREAVQSQMGVHYSSATPEWSTPQDLFDQLDAEFTFDLDVCATDENAKCTLYFTHEVDGLSQEWTGTCWMNPPYGDEIVAWVAKAATAAANGATVVCLLPARTDTRWWWDYARFGEVRFLRGRLKFGGGENSAPFPSAVVIFGREPKMFCWERS